MSTINAVEIQSFLNRYFQAFDSKILDAGPGYIRVHLPEILDKDLTNRPLYWSFIERTGGEAQTMTLTFIFDPEQCLRGVEGEMVSFGSPKLQQIFSSVQKHGKWTRMYEQFEEDILSSAPSRPLLPWLSLNFKIQFLSDKKKDMLYSLGCNLFSGELVENFMSILKQKRLTACIPPRVHTLAPNLRLDEAKEFMEQWLKKRIVEADTSWAQAAKKRLEEEIAILHSYFFPDDEQTKKQHELKNEENLPSKSYEQHLKELKWQYEPRVEVDVINGGLFYLKT